MITDATIDLSEMTTLLVTTDSAIDFSEMTTTQASEFAATVRRSVQADPASHMDREITPFATPRGLMGGDPPSRIRLFSRRRWMRDLEARAFREILRQRHFALTINLIGRMLPRPRAT